jgi:DNA polymerase-3 subunit gamma/tau
MRDALSILDKIVSFTNSELNYQNTLEHLNILDADYYFKLIDCMQQQDLAGAMLLYDDINRKGFEGDMLLNGFAEFLRNLFVSKDERCADLLEVVEGFREKYVSTAKKVSGGWLVSALNILNEAELNFKAARNKRLHVELALIKLCYLQQAIELTNDANGGSKKKLIETAKPLAFRKIEPIEIETTKSEARDKTTRSQKSEAKLIIETVSEEKILFEEESPLYDEPGTDQNVKPGNTAPAPRSSNTKLAALDKIRNHVRGAGSHENGNGIVAKPLQLEELQQAWNEYAAKLREEKNPAGQNFEMAELRVQDANSFIALVNNNIQLRFIEQQGLKASQILREKLQNNQLQFYIVMRENTGEHAVAESPLSSREQFQKMTEQYPLVKELKDRLRLELDY